jgi:3-oxoacyl-[acyl-carrier protein] reductase
MPNYNALITGASRGLGEAIAREFVNQGASVALVARNTNQLQQLADELRKSARGEVHVIAADLADADAPAAIMERLRAVWPQLDVLVNNAAITGPIGPLRDNDWSQWEAAIRINLLAPVALCRLAIPWMKAGSAIVNISGGGATGPRPNFSAYGTTKAALVRFTETLAQETAELGIRVNAIAPGAMNTEMLEAVLRSGDLAGKELARAQEQKQKGGVPPEKAAALVYYLATPASDGITGRLVSAVWDPWSSLSERAAELRESDIYTLRRITPEDRGKKWG